MLSVYIVIATTFSFYLIVLFIIFKVKIVDGTGQQWVTCFPDTAETLLGKLYYDFILYGKMYKLWLLGKSSEEIGKLKDSDHVEFDKLFENATFKWYIFRLRVKMETYKVINNYNVKPIGPDGHFIYFVWIGRKTSENQRVQCAGN